MSGEREEGKGRRDGVDKERDKQREACIRVSSRLHNSL
jgi:hypothetical protein